MALRRYARDTILGFGSHYGTAKAIGVIRRGVSDGTIRSKQLLLGERDRLDIVAGREYGDASLWWVISAASDIGWALQLPANTVLTVPLLQDVAKLLG